MSINRSKLSKSEIDRAFHSEAGAAQQPILTLSQIADLIRVPRKTIYDWIAKGRLDGTFRKRGKRHLFWRDRVVELIFNGGDWNERR